MFNGKWQNGCSVNYLGDGFTPTLFDPSRLINHWKCVYDFYEQKKIKQ